MKREHELIQRAKELNCLYNIDTIIRSNEKTFATKLQGVVDTLPYGFQYNEFCSAHITIDSDIYSSKNHQESDWFLATDFYFENEILGHIFVFYHKELPDNDEGPFSSEERKLLNTTAEWISRELVLNKLKVTAENCDPDFGKPEWEVILDMQKKTDRTIYSIISRKMLNQMLCSGIKEANDLYKNLGSVNDPKNVGTTEVNQPTKKQVLQYSFDFSNEIFALAKNYYSNIEMLEIIRRWIYEEKMKGLMKYLSNENASISEIADSLQHYQQVNPEITPEGSKINIGIVVSLLSKFFTDQLSFLNIAKNFIDISDFYELTQTTIYPPQSMGKLGGKSAGLIIASKILQKSAKYAEILDNVKIPKTWYITSDCTISFLTFNNLEDMNEQKYRDLDDIGHEYPHIIQTFKNLHFPPFIINGLSRALDDFGDTPIIVRSSSLLEDRLGTAFAGKYKSLFLANQGPKERRLEELLDAIAEVYASLFSPDAIGYRKEKGLLDFNEQMGIMIQEVVGHRFGKYYFPVFAGVAFSKNEFRWSPRIKREDGLIRLVPGLGTRAVDRIGNDFPLLISPGQPNLRSNVSYMDIVRYCPHKMDVINLETNSFDTVNINTLVKEVGNSFPLLNEVFSIDENGMIRQPIGLGIDVNKHDIVPTFENLFSKSNFIEKMKAMLNELNIKLGYSIDLEFAADSNYIYILQCRPQSEFSDSVSAIIPNNIPLEQTLFTATKFVSNGKVPNISYIVYVDPEKYESMSEYKDMLDIGRAVGKLNQILPKKSFILMGPGRWGTRDDIKMGVKITYSDINNTSMLIEIAKRKSGYTPDLSFGTHFFQDLVEASIKYLPLYPDEPENYFNTVFFEQSSNSLLRYIPEFAHVSDIIKVINIRENTNGNILRILMNADDDKAIACISSPDSITSYENYSDRANNISDFSDEPLQWRKRMADSIANHIKVEKFGIKGIYLYGSVFSEKASASADIDLIIHFGGTPRQKQMLEVWLDAWNSCLCQINYNKSGYMMKKILDVTIIEDRDFDKRKYIASLIDHTSHSSKKLKLNRTIL